MDKSNVLQTIALVEDRCVLATVINVEGSAYRKEGAMMLFTESGSKIGMISVGCLEEDLEIRANKLIAHAYHQSEIVVYDMSAEDDLSWGSGVGCNGKVHILLEKISSEQRENLIKVHQNLEQGIDVIAIKLLKSVPSIVPTVYQTKNDDVFGHHEPIYEDPFNGSRLNKLIGNKYIHHFKPRSRLFIFGAGADVKPLANIAVMLDFSVHIWDWRPALLSKKVFPGTIFIQDESLEQLTLYPTDFVVIMTHDFQRDKLLLNKLLTYKPFQYFGILGPRKRTAKLLENKEIPAQIQAPVGLAIGAEGAEEIAISIIADLIRVKRGVSSLEKSKNSRNLFSSR